MTRSNNNILVTSTFIILIVLSMCSMYLVAPQGFYNLILKNKSFISVEDTILLVQIYVVLSITLLGYIMYKYNKAKS